MNRGAILGALLGRLSAAGYQSVVIMGDMNSHDIGEELLKNGYRWPTEKNRRTISFGNWDHVFLKGARTAGDLSTGVVADNPGPAITGRFGWKSRPETNRAADP